MMNFNYFVYENSNLKAGFVNEIDAINYKQMLKDINRLAGYKDKYTIKTKEEIKKLD